MAADTRDIRTAPTGVLSNSERQLWLTATAEPPGPLIRLLVPVPACSEPLDDGSGTQEPEYDEDEEGESGLERGAQSFAAQRKRVRQQFAARRLATALQALQPGGPCVCWPTPKLEHVAVVVSGKVRPGDLWLRER